MISECYGDDLGELFVFLDKHIYVLKNNCDELKSRGALVARRQI